jgi:ribosome assembly protein SQT1
MSAPTQPPQGDEIAEHEGADHGEGDVYVTVEDAEEIDESELQSDEPMEGDSDDDDDDDDDEHEQDGSRDVEDTSQARFASHSPKSIFSLATHPVSPFLAVSGGEDDMGYLWKMDTGEEVTKLTGHTDSVVSAGFSADGEFVATGGMDGAIRIWGRVKNAPGWEWATWQFVTSLDGPDEVVVRVSMRVCLTSSSLSFVVVDQLASKGPRISGRRERRDCLDVELYAQLFLCALTDLTYAAFAVPGGQTMNVFTGHTDAVTAGQFTPDGTLSQRASLKMLWTDAETDDQASAF